MGAGLLESIDRSTQLAGYNRLALLLFKLDERQIFGINVLKVQEVLLRPPTTKMPSSHPYVVGVADIRGMVVPIIDMRRALGQPSDDHAAHIIVTEYNRSVQAFLVRAVDRIIHINVESVLPPPRSASDEGYLTAITQYGDELIEIVDVERVLAEVIGTPPALSEQLRDEQYDFQHVRGRRVLVADDSRVARAQIERVLQQLGIESVLVNDGREALRYLQGLAEQGGAVTDRLLMVISDVEMPDMDGYALTSEIRRDKRLRDLYVILHTSLSGVFNNAMIKKVGADVFIPKFSSDDLAQGILDRLKAEHNELQQLKMV
jgi:two-component system chemotaxis response regulator CheV